MLLWAAGLVDWHYQAQWCPVGYVMSYRYWAWTAGLQIRSAEVLVSDYSPLFSDSSFLEYKCPYFLP